MFIEPASEPVKINKGLYQCHFYRLNSTVVHPVVLIHAVLVKDPVTSTTTVLHLRPEWGSYPLSSHRPEHRLTSTEQPIVEQRKKAFLVQTNISGPEKILLFKRFQKNRCKNIDGCCNKVTKTGFMFSSFFFFLFFFPLRFKIFCCSWRRIVFAFFRNAKHVR